MTSLYVVPFERVHEAFGKAVAPGLYAGVVIGTNPSSCA